MSERFQIMYSPEKGSGGGKKESPKPEKPLEQKKTVEKIPPKEIGIIGKMRALFGSKEMRKQLRKEANRKQRTAESQAHLASSEIQISRLAAFDEALGTTTFHDPAVADLAKSLFNKLRKIRSPKLSAEEKNLHDQKLAEEARQYIYAGLLTADPKMPLREKSVARHIRAYLIWRWAEDEWQKPPPKKWRLWGKEKPTQQSMVPSQPTESLPQFRAAVREWTQERNKGKHGSELPRPPGIPENNLVVLIAKRLREDHAQWKVAPIKPDFGISEQEN